MARYNNNKPTEIEGANVGTTKHAKVKRAALACENVVSSFLLLQNSSNYSTFYYVIKSDVATF